MSLEVVHDNDVAQNLEDESARVVPGAGYNLHIAGGQNNVVVGGSDFIQNLSVAEPSDRQGEVRALIAHLRDLLAGGELEGESAREVEAEVRTVEAQLDKTKPSWRTIIESLASAETVLKAAEAVPAAIALASQIGQFLGQHWH
ncbi:MAG: hypothetical protein KGR26_01735 [Cyanobacteria bacterium REEB65]|nr:hypothetical protein [Cyanobacteria bacterium REEB65]